MKRYYWERTRTTFLVFDRHDSNEPMCRVDTVYDVERIVDGLNLLEEKIPGHSQDHVDFSKPEAEAT